MVKQSTTEEKLELIYVSYQLEVLGIKLSGSQ